MLNAQSAIVQGLIGQLLFQGELLATRFLGRHEELDLGQRERQKAQVLQQPAPRRQGRGRRVGNGLIVSAAAIGVAQEEDEKQGIDQQDIFDCVVSFLAAITRLLFNRVLGADDASCRPVMGTRGDAAATAGTATSGAAASSSGAIRVAAAASATPSRWAKAVSER